MVLLKVSPLLLVAAVLAAGSSPLAAQTGQEPPPAGFKVVPVRETPAQAPFSASVESTGRVNSIEFRTPAQMTQKDLDVEADGEASIRERVTFANLEFNQGAWSFQQIVCSALPNHVLLKFTRNNGAGDVSMFSASIPRMGDGRVRIIPILRRGYSLFSPTPVNAITISAFNHIRAEEHPDGQPDWLTTALCYGALAGAHPVVAQVQQGTDGEKFPSAPPATLQLSTQGTATVRFTDAAAPGKPMEWTMAFDRKGRLLKATHTAASLVTARQTNPAPVDLHGTPIP